MRDRSGDRELEPPHPYIICREDSPGSGQVSEGDQCLGQNLQPELQAVPESTWDATGIFYFYHLGRKELYSK